MIDTSPFEARAGGGESYDSSSSSSSSSSSPSSSSSSNYNTSTQSNRNSSYDDTTAGGTGSVGGIGGWIFLGVIVLFFVIAAVSSLRSKKGKGDQTFFDKNPQFASDSSNPPVQPHNRPKSDPRAGLNKIIERDPGFSEQAFKDKTENAFFKIQEAWETQNLEIARPFVSESIMQRYSNQIADLKSRGERNILENIVIGGLTISDVKSDANFDYVTVKIDASAVDYTLDSEGNMKSGSKDSGRFTEFWTMMRTAGTKTAVNQGSEDQKCPSCGAPLQANATGKCTYCGTVVASGNYDWILSEIKQD